MRTFTSCTMSGDIWKSPWMETMPLWLMKPSCMVAPSRRASSPDCKPPLIRALKASLLLPVDTPGRSTAKLADERGLPDTINGRSLTVSGSMPP